MSDQKLTFRFAVLSVLHQDYGSFDDAIYTPVIDALFPLEGHCTIEDLENIIRHDVTASDPLGQRYPGLVSLIDLVARIEL